MAKTGTAEEIQVEDIGEWWQTFRDDSTWEKMLFNDRHICQRLDKKVNSLLQRTALVISFCLTFDTVANSLAQTCLCGQFASNAICLPCWQFCSPEWSFEGPEQPNCSSQISCLKTAWDSVTDVFTTISFAFVMMLSSCHSGILKIFSNWCLALITIPILLIVQIKK